MRIRDLLSGPPPSNPSSKSYRTVDKPWNRFGPAVPYPEGENRNLELASYLSDATLATLSVAVCTIFDLRARKISKFGTRSDSFSHLCLNLNHLLEWI